MTGHFRIDDCEDLVLPGMPGDYLDTSVVDDENLALLAERDVLLQVLGDRTRLPTTEAREGYYGTRHLEYWLSGLRDMRKVVAATKLDDVKSPRILDFGGASGRVARHFLTWRPDSELYLSDINPQHVLLTKRLFEGRVRSLRNRGVPALPFPDGYLDCAVAFSVFTHIDSEDTAWLMELRRIIKPGGHLYVTIHNEATWEILPNSVLSGVSFANEQFRSHYSTMPKLNGRKVHTYSDESDYQCNVFLGQDYIDRHWAPLFRGYTISPLAHDHQAALMLTV